MVLSFSLAIPIEWFLPMLLIKKAPRSGHSRPPYLMTIAMSNFLSVAMFAFLTYLKVPPPGIVGVTPNDLECSISAGYAPPGPLNFSECHGLLSLKKI
jgi:hypothetical protein